MGNVQSVNQGRADGDDCTHRGFFDYEHTCTASRWFPEEVTNRREDHGPYVTCRHTGEGLPHEDEDGRKVCRTKHDDRCRPLPKRWCCGDMIDGENTWTFLTDEIEQDAKVMKDGVCVGCRL